MRNVAQQISSADGDAAVGQVTDGTCRGCYDKHAAFEKEYDLDMFQIIILICAIGLTPADCQKETAIDVFRGPVASNEVMWGLHGQAFIAQTSLARHSSGEYVKIRCERTSGVREALRRRLGAERDE